MISEVVDNTDTETMGPMLNTTHVSSGASNTGTHTRVDGVASNFHSLLVTKILSEMLVFMVNIKHLHSKNIIILK